MSKPAIKHPTYIMKYWIILMMIVLGFMNIMMLILANVLYNREIKREYTSMVELVSHLAYYEDHQMIQTYLEHYEHTHHVVIAFQDDAKNMIYPTIIDDSWTFEPLVYQDELVGYFYIDYQNSWLNQDYVIFFFIFNGVLILIFSFILFFARESLIRLTRMWHDELNHLYDPNYAFSIDVIKEAHDRVMKTISQEKNAQNIYQKHIQRLAHDIKTPLTSSMIYLEGIQNKRLTMNDEITQDIMDELHKIDEIIPQFIASDIHEIACVQDISLIISDLISRYQDVLVTKNMNLITHLEPLETKITQKDLQTILDHLVFNAFYYSAPHKKIWIETYTQSKTLVIKDEGLGMDEDTVMQLTKTIIRGPEASVYYAKGTGMGYMILGDLMKKINAKLGIDSKLNRGTTITITFSSI